MVFAAQTGRTDQLAWLLFATALIWAVIYDTFYAMVDREDDRRIGVKSTAILFGDADLFVVGGLQVLMLVGLVLVGRMAGRGGWYYGALVVAALLMASHQELARDRSPAGCLKGVPARHYVGMGGVGG